MGRLAPRRDSAPGAAKGASYKQMQRGASLGMPGRRKSADGHCVAGLGGRTAGNPWKLDGGSAREMHADSGNDTLPAAGMAAATVYAGKVR